MGQEGAQKILIGVPTRIVCVWGSLQMFCQECPPLLQGVQERGGLAGLVAQVGAFWVRAEWQNIFEGIPTQIVFVRGGLQMFFQGHPPLLQGVQEVGTLVSMVDRVGDWLVGLV